MRSPRAGRSVTPMRWRGRAAERSGRSAFAVGFAVQSLLALWLFERASNSRLQLQALSSSGPTFSLLYGQADHPAPTGERRRHSRGDSIPFGTRHPYSLAVVCRDHHNQSADSRSTALRSGCRSRAPVQVSDNFIGVAAAANLKVNSAADLIHVARGQSGKLNWAATPGLPYYVVLALEQSAGIEMLQVGYRDFAPAPQDLATGRLHVAATGVPPLVPHHQAGTAKLLFVTNRERSPQVPEVPTAREAGYSDLSHSLASAVSPTRTPTRLPSCCERAIPPQLGARACRPTGRLRSTSIPSLVSGWTAARRRSITVKGRGRPLRRSYARLSQFGAAVPALQASAHSSRPFLSGSDRTSSGPNSSQPSFVLDEFIPHLKVEKIRRHGVALRLGGKSEGRRLLRRVRDIRAM